MKLNSVVCCVTSDAAVVSCDSSEFGCCPDGHTIAPGPNGTGCPSKIRPLFTYLFIYQS